MTLTVTTPRVVCVVQCPAVMDKMRTYVDETLDTYNWELNWHDLMDAACCAAEGKFAEMERRLEGVVGLPLLDPRAYGANRDIEQLADLVEAMGLAIKHALPGMYSKEDSQLVACRYLETTRQFFVFEVQLSKPASLGDLA